MGEMSYNSDIINRYLLGDLSPAEQESLEEDFFIDNDLFIELLDAEDRLISDYLSGRLSASDRDRFERHFLTLPESRQDVELAYMLQSGSARQSFTEHPTPNDRKRYWWHEILGMLRSNPVLAGATATAMVAVAATSIWLAMRSEPEKIHPEISSSPTASTGSTASILELTPGQERSGVQMPQVILGPGIHTVTLKLDVGTADYPNYHAKLLRIGVGVTPILASNTLKSEKNSAGGTVVLWEISARELQSGNYQVKLDGINADGSNENIGSYYFIVRN